MQKTQQMNIRIEPELKARGDAVLSRLKITPSEAVRTLWQYLCDTRRMPDDLCAGGASDASGGEAARRVAAVDEGAGLASHLAAAMGVSLAADDADYDKLKEDAFEELLAEMNEKGTPGYA